MGITTVQKFILFTLGSWHLEAQRKFSDKPIQVVISKAKFIEVARNAQFVTKQARALYKNLEDLEKRKLLSYDHKALALTSKGQKLFDRLYADLRPYVNVIHVLKQENPLSYVRLQTVLQQSF